MDIDFQLSKLEYEDIHFLFDDILLKRISRDNKTWDTVGLLFKVDGSFGLKFCEIRLLSQEITPITATVYILVLII